MFLQKILLKIYSTFGYLFLPLILVRVLLKSIQLPAYRKRWKERLGRPLFAPLNKSIWIHAVSVGEVLAALPLINELANRHLGYPIVVTTTTPTGSELLTQKLGNTVKHCYLPYDLPALSKRFLKHIQPRIAIVMETEVWPNHFILLKRKNIPLVLVNARISNKSYKRYSRITFFIGPILDSCTFILAQSEADALKFSRLKAAKDKIIVIGNLKFDINVPQDQVMQGKKLREKMGTYRPVWIAASTHPGEEEIILRAHGRIRQELPDALLCLVPRHPERFFSVSELSRQMKYFTLRHSQFSFYSSDLEQAVVYIGDTMGELMLYYSASDIAVVGGSFVPVGGHNVLEPISLGLPVITGPYLHNFEHVSKLLFQEEAMLLASDAQHLSEGLINLFKDKNQISSITLKAKRIIETHKGATERTIQYITQLLRSNFS